MALKPSSASGNKHPLIISFPIGAHGQRRVSETSLHTNMFAKAYIESFIRRANNHNQAVASKCHSREEMMASASEAPTVYVSLAYRRSSL